MSKSNEFFYLDKQGKKQDRDLHADMLGPDLNGIVHPSSIEVARQAGLSDEDLKLLGLIND